LASEASFFSRLRQGLSKTRDQFAGRLDRLLPKGRQVDAALLEELEEALVTSDLGVKTAAELMTGLGAAVKREGLESAEDLKAYLRRAILEILQPVEKPLEVPRLDRPWVLLALGVNGTGKTTTIGKIALRLRQQGRSVLLAAADTFRAAAIQQLEIWGQRAGVEVIKHQEGADPSAVAFDAIKAAQKRGVEVVIIDTAGRLHTRKNLMEELKKMKRIVAREQPGTPDEVLLVLDATTGQNALAQAKIFHEAIGITGLCLTKLDGTAKGGIVIAISREFGIPIRLIGVGEQIEDLQTFRAEEFVRALI
jgi:fused signal recognition particle receptor